MVAAEPVFRTKNRLEITSSGGLPTEQPDQPGIKEWAWVKVTLLVTDIHARISRGGKMSHETTPQDEEMYLVARKKIRCISVCEHVTRRHGPVTDFEAARALLKPFFDQEPYEAVYCIALDSSNRFLAL